MATVAGSTPAAADRHHLGHGELGLSLLVTASAFAAARTQSLWEGQIRVLCPLLQLTGIPCPTCGGTRAMAALAAPDWPAALAWNPLVALGGIGALAWSALALAALAGLVNAPAIPTRLPVWVRWAMPLAIVANELWLLATFPG